MFDLREKVDCPAVRRHPSNNVEMSGSWVENAVINYIALARVDWKGVKRKVNDTAEVFDYDIFECPEELKGQLKIGDFFG